MSTPLYEGTKVRDGPRYALTWLQPDDSWDAIEVAVEGVYLMLLIGKHVCGDQGICEAHIPFTKGHERLTQYVFISGLNTLIGQYLKEPFSNLIPGVAIER